MRNRAPQIRPLLERVGMEMLHASVILGLSSLIGQMVMRSQFACKTDPPMASTPATPPYDIEERSQTMPIYEYERTPCLVVYETMHGMNHPPPERCPKCGGPLHRMISSPRINRYNFSSPTEAKYAKVSRREEIAREQELQKVYERIWLPPPVQHTPWD
jgi:putative FmdB family regulatory protein